MGCKNCSTCYGNGKVSCFSCGGTGHGSALAGQTFCSSCGGRCQVKCSTCGGSGKVYSSDSDGESSGGGCFLTTACCKHAGLPDDCWELTTLRIFRDRYRQSSQAAEEEINIYYELAPKLVCAIENAPNPDDIFKIILLRVREAAKCAEDGLDKKALYIYRTEFSKLIEQYL